MQSFQLKHISCELISVSAYWNSKLVQTCNVVVTSTEEGKHTSYELIKSSSIYATQELRRLTV
jgi:D-arabinose 5-phosphate isomerase GutQ